MTTNAPKPPIQNSTRGLVGTIKPCTIPSANNPAQKAWNAESYAFLDNPCPETSNESLWAQSKLNQTNGLFEVTAGVYQIRGLDLANMTIIEGDSGIIVLDPLTTTETASEALSLYRSVRGERPVSALLYSNASIDHFGGARGILPDIHGVKYDIPIIAPRGFMEAAIDENVLVGNAMAKRTGFIFGSSLPRNELGTIGCGVGSSVSVGGSSLIPPNIGVKVDGEERVVDGVRMVFQLIPDSVAGAQMNCYFSVQRSLFISEAFVNGMACVSSLRGGQAVDAKGLSKVLDRALVLFGDEAEVLCLGYTWPTWGKEEIGEIVAAQRDLYAFLHDQTVRLMNRGLNGVEIAEILKLPVGLQAAWHARGFYGSVSQNVKGIYQRYMGWFDGDAARLWEHPPAENAKRYVVSMGGIDEVIRKAEQFVREGDLRFAATLLGHAVSADPMHAASKEALASVYTRLGFGAENAIWRNYYLSAAQDLGKMHGSQTKALGSGMKIGQSVDQWLDLLAIRLNGTKAGAECFTIHFHLPDEQRWWRVNLSNGALTYRSALAPDGFSGVPDLTLTLPKKELFSLLGGIGLQHAHLGDLTLFERLLSLIED
jgi:alkyl sulfatase BDS1-like metallo-beta-lactamase superfamily hydrolase